MSDGLVAAFVAIASALFVTELTDKDALLILTLATRTRPSRVFFAGATAFVLTTTVFVTLGTIAIRLIPILWIKLAGGTVMIGYAVWVARGLIGQKVIEEEEERIESTKDGLKAFLLMVGALAFLDLAGDATEVLTIVFVAQYANALLVFSATCVGLIAATAVETALGYRLGRALTPGRIRYASVLVFMVLGSFILVASLL
jgi:putative Ca2+/H+ antiporter (TMEM165/GDT1 family)